MLRLPSGYWEVAGLGRDTLQPGAHRREAGEIEPAFAGDVGVGVEGDVRDGVAVPDEEIPDFQVTFHYVQRVVAELAFGLQGEPAFFGDLDAVRDPEPRGGYVRLVAVLLDVLSVFAEFEGLTSSNPPNAPLISARPSA